MLYAVLPKSAALLLKCVLIVYIWPEKGVYIYIYIYISLCLIHIVNMDFYSLRPMFKTTQLPNFDVWKVIFNLFSTTALTIVLQLVLGRASWMMNTTYTYRRDPRRSVSVILSHTCKSKCYDVMEVQGYQLGHLRPFQVMETSVLPLT